MQSSRKFEVTQFFQLGLKADYFVKRGVFQPLELRHIQMLRQQLNQKFPQTKRIKIPGSWHLTIETVDGDFMTGRLSVITPAHKNLHWTQMGTVEYVCETFQRMLRI